MTDINFYVSSETGIEKRLAIVYRLVVKAIERNLSVYIFCDDSEPSEAIDKLFWTREPESFIPHSFITDNRILQSAKIANEIKIFHPSGSENEAPYEPLHHCDFLINLSKQRPSFFSRFSKVAEVLDSSEEILTAGRKRYSFYRERGYNLEYHKL